MHEEVIHFIDNFKRQKKSDVEFVFTNGDCYWFSVILIQRFGGEAYYLRVRNHFITKIDGRYYDITGEITDFDEEPVSWTYMQETEPKWAERIYYCALLQD